MRYGNLPRNGSHSVGSLDCSSPESGLRTACERLLLHAKCRLCSTILCPVCREPKDFPIRCPYRLMPLLTILNAYLRPECRTLAARKHRRLQGGVQHRSGSLSQRCCLSTANGAARWKPTFARTPGRVVQIQFRLIGQHVLSAN